MTTDTRVRVHSTGRELVHVNVTTDPPVDGTWQISTDRGATWADLEAGAWTVSGTTYGHRVLIAGPDCPEPAVAGQVTITAPTVSVLARVVDYPEVPVTRLFTAEIWT